MLVELILVVISLLAMVVLVSIRHLKLAYAKNENRNFFVGSDHKLNSWFFQFEKFCLNTYRDVKNLFKDLPHIILIFLSKVFFILHKKTRKLVDLIKGNKVPTNKGSVSLYLQKIEKDK